MSKTRKTADTSQAEATNIVNTLPIAEAAHAKAQPGRHKAILAALEVAKASQAAEADKAAKRAEAKAAKAEAKPRGPSMVDDAKAILEAAGGPMPVKALVEAIRALRPTLGAEAKGALEARKTAEAAQARGDAEAAKAAEDRAIKAADSQASATIAATLYTAAKAGKLALEARGVIGLAKAS
jgi:hypothetical protein